MKSTDLQDLIDIENILKMPRYAGGHDEQMKGLFRGATVLAHWNEGNYQGIVATITRNLAMLVLSRREKQEIIAGDIRITIIKIGKETVKVGIDAPQETKVMRSELLKGGSQCPPSTDDGQKNEPE